MHKNFITWKKTSHVTQAVSVRRAAQVIAVFSEDGTNGGLLMSHSIPFLLVGNICFPVIRGLSLKRSALDYGTMPVMQVPYSAAFLRHQWGGCLIWHAWSGQLHSLPKLDLHDLVPVASIVRLFHERKAKAGLVSKPFKMMYDGLHTVLSSFTNGWWLKLDL